MMFRNFLFGGGDPQNENLDRPVSNFDEIGIPTGAWSSHFCACHQNILPSCLLSFFCPCMMWSQIVVRAQIPMLISIKNSIITCPPRKSGFGAFMDFFMWSLIISGGLIVLMVVVPISHGVVILLGAIVFLILLTFTCALGHTRTAFKEKYELPTFLPPGCHFWDMLLDIVITNVCMPCALAQMARHVFQYDRMDTKLGLFLGDPSTLPPLRPTDEEQGVPFERPERADTAGLTWEHNGRHPNAVDNSGAAHRQQEIQARQQQQMRDENVGYNPHLPVGGASAPMASATVVSTQPGARNNSGTAASGAIYNVDGSRQK